MKNRSKLLTILLILVVPQLAFAADVTFGLNMGNIFYVSPGDYSVIFLKRLFGDVGFNLSAMAGAQSRTILGELFRIFNLGILTVASFVMIFTIVKVIIDTAHSGEMMGRQQGNTGWLVIRTSVGLAALVPSFSGYSFLQGLVMWMILQSIGFANSAWNTSLDYLNKNGVIYTTSENLQESESNSSVIDLNLVSAYLANDQKDTKDGGADSVLLSMSCMFNVEHAINDVLDNKNADMSAHPDNYNETQTKALSRLQDYLVSGGIRPYFNDAKKTLIIPNAIPSTDPLNYQEDWKTVFGSDTQNIVIAKVGGICGTYNWSVGSSVKGASDYEYAKKAGLQWQVENLSSLAKHLVDISYSEEASNKTSETFNCDASVECQALISSASQYQTAVYSSRLFAVAKDQENATDWITDAKNVGWAMAGRYYYDVGKSFNKSSALDKDSYQIRAASQSFTDFYSNSTKSIPWNNLSQALNGALNPQYMNALQGVFQQIQQSASGAVDKAEAINEAAKTSTSGEMEDLSTTGYLKNKEAKDFSPGPLTYIDITTIILNSRAKNVIDTWIDTMVNTKDNPNPIINLMTVGNKMMSEASKVWSDILYTMYATAVAFTIPLWAGYVVQGLAGIITGAAPLVGIGPAMSAASMTYSSIIQFIYQIFSTLAFMGLPLVIGVTAPMYVFGAILGIYIPLLPFMIFTFGVISWLILVIESMAAAPLVALGLTHPQGHDFLGKSDQAIMLLLNVFLRPICMIIGLVAAMVLSFIALSVLNAGFGSIVTSVFGDPKNSIKSIIILVVYTFIVMSLVNQCFALIYVIGDKIGTWLGMPAQPSDIEKHVEGVKQGVQQGMQEGVSGMGQTTAGTKSVGELGSGVSKAGGEISGIWAKHAKKSKKNGNVVAS
jgi:defect in organelle trafficking protein DotA